jgi:hypothetical protein
MIMDDVALEDVRLELERMDEAFCAAMLKAIDAGEEYAPRTTCTKPGTRNPIFVLA